MYSQITYCVQTDKEFQDGIVYNYASKSNGQYMSCYNIWHPDTDYIECYNFVCDTAK